MGVFEGLQIHIAEFEPLTPLLYSLPAFGVQDALNPLDLKSFLWDGFIEDESDNFPTFSEGNI